MAPSVFYSFDPDRDIRRAQLVNSIGAVEGQSVLDAPGWDEVRASGPHAMATRIEREISRRAALIVLIGRRTATRSGVVSEIQTAWRTGKPLLGVYVHGLLPDDHLDIKGPDPFQMAGLAGASVPVFDPTSFDWRGHFDSDATFHRLSGSLEAWIAAGRIRTT